MIQREGSCEIFRTISPLFQENHKTNLRDVPVVGSVASLEQMGARTGNFLGFISCLLLGGHHKGLLGVVLRREGK